MNTPTRLIALLLALVLFAACGAGQAAHPEVIVDESSCAHCRMLVSDLRHAAGVVTSDGSEYVYDDVACLIASNAASEPGATIWFHAFDEDAWTLARDTTFVDQQKVRGPMGGTALAFASAERANSAASALQGEVVTSLNTLATKGDHR